MYYRGPEPLETLSQVRGKRLAVGPEGSGTRALALALLKGNGIEGPPTILLDEGGEEAARALTSGSADAAFLMGDSATPKLMRSLRDVPATRSRMRSTRSRRRSRSPISCTCCASTST